MPKSRGLSLVGLPQIYLHQRHYNDITAEFVDSTYT